MRSRIFHDLGRCLATRLERGAREGGAETAVPVFLCHPLEALERDEPESGARACGVLYLYRISPRSRYRSAAPVIEGGRGSGKPARVRAPGLWVRLRYAFLVVGGTQQEELAVLATALRVLHGSAYVPVSELSDESGSLEEDLEVEALPLEFVDDPAAWREIGLDEHRLTVCFEVGVPLPVGAPRELDLVIERELEVKVDGAPSAGGDA